MYLLLTIGIAGSISCSSTSPSPASADLQVTVTPNPIVQTAIGACVNPFTQTPAGTFRLFPHSVTVQETGGVGVAIQSYKVTALSGGQEVSAVDLAAGDIPDRFSGCGGTANRIEARQTRCTPTSPFCVPTALAVPSQIRVQFSAVDDNGNTITADRIVSLVVPQ